MEPDAPLDLETVWRELDALAVVNSIRVDDVVEKMHRSRSNKRVICTVWCCANHTGDDRQPSVKCNNSTCPDIEHAMRDLRVKILEKHAGCIAAAEAARATAGDPATRQPSDALATIMAARKAQQASARTEAALKAGEARAGAARAALAAAELEVSTLKVAAVRRMISQTINPVLSLLESPC